MNTENTNTPPSAREPDWADKATEIICPEYGECVHDIVADTLRRFCASPSALEAAGLCHKSDVDTMKEVSDSNRKDYMDLVMLLKGLVPDTYNLHVRVVADELLATCTQLRKRVEELDKASRNVIDLAEDFDASFYRRQSDLACALCDLAALLSDSEKEGGTAKPEAKTEERG